MEFPTLTLLVALRQRYPTAKHQTLKRMAADGRVRVNGQVVSRLNHPIQAADTVEVSEAGRASSDEHARNGRTGDAGQLTIVFEDADVLVVNKPAGLLTSTVAGERRPTLLAMVREHVAARHPNDRRVRVGLIHRLDRDAAGLLVFSKNDTAYQSLKSQFFHHDVERVYAALVTGTPNPAKGRIESHLVERADGTVRSTREPGKGQRAVTDYRVIEQSGGQALLDVTLHTGRKHQIRVHLSERGWPIVGDKVYGVKADQSGQPGSDGPLMLIARRLAFSHPRTGQRVAFDITAYRDTGFQPVRDVADGVNRGI